MTREDFKRFCALDIDFGSIGLNAPGGTRPQYFCDPVGGEHVGSIGCDGVHFILLPGDERVFCVDPSMGDVGTYVLPVGENFREFLSFILYCRDANPLSQIFWMTEERFRKVLEEDESADWPSAEAYFARKNAALERLASEFDITPAYPYEKVKVLQATFDGTTLNFTDEYYDVLGIERD